MEFKINISNKRIDKEVSNLTNQIKEGYEHISFTKEELGALKTKIKPRLIKEISKLLLSKASYLMDDALYVEDYLTDKELDALSERNSAELEKNTVYKRVTLYVPENKVDYFSKKYPIREDS